MGLIDSVFNMVFGAGGSGGNVVRETAEVFRENAEAASAREADLQRAAIDAFAAEFAHSRSGRFDRFMDGLNRIPRPALALSTLGLFVAAMVSPAWFSARMQGVALVPEPLWWLMGVIVSFYFGARHQMKGQELQRALAASLSLSERRVRRDLQGETAPMQVVQRPKQPRPKPAASLSAPIHTPRPVDTTANAALADWQRTRRGR